MKKIKSSEEALSAFIDASENHMHGILNGDYKFANKSYNGIVQAVDFLKSVGNIGSLQTLLNSQSVGVRSWAATYLLPVHEQLALSVLANIAKGEGIIARDAGLVISEWGKGNLKL